MTSEMRLYHNAVLGILDWIHTDVQIPVIDLGTNGSLNWECLD